MQEYNQKNSKAAEGLIDPGCFLICYPSYDVDHYSQVNLIKTFCRNAI